MTSNQDGDGVRDVEAERGDARHRGGRQRHRALHRPHGGRGRFKAADAEAHQGDDTAQGWFGLRTELDIYLFS